MTQQFYLLSILLFVLFTSPTSTFAQQKLVWSAFGQGQLHQANTYGSAANEWLQIPASTTSLVLAPQARDLYFMNSRRGTIYRMSLQTQIVEEVLTGLPSPNRLIVDETSGKMYWGDQDEDAIFSANLDGTNMENLMSDVALNPQGLALDTIANVLYFGQQSGEIESLNLTTGERELLATNNGVPSSLLLDLANNQLFWTSENFQQASGIHAYDLTTSVVTDIYTTGMAIYDMAIDFEQQRLYWTDWGGSFPKTIRSANLDGSDVEDVVSFNDHSPYALVLLDALLVDTDSPLPQTQEITVYPNPVQAGQPLLISANEPYHALKLYTGNGQLVWQSKATVEQSIVIPAGLTVGTYYLQVQGEDWVARQQLLIH